MPWHFVNSEEAGYDQWWNDEITISLVISSRFLDLLFMHQWQHAWAVTLLLIRYENFRPPGIYRRSSLWMWDLGSFANAKCHGVPVVSKSLHSQCLRPHLPAFSGTRVCFLSNKWAAPNCSSYCVLVTNKWPGISGILEILCFYRPRQASDLSGCMGDSTAWDRKTYDCIRLDSHAPFWLKTVS